MTPALRTLARIGPPRLLVAGLLIALVHGGYLLWVGVQMAPDSQAYAHYSARLIAEGFDYATVEREVQAGFPPYLYAVFVTLVAVLRLVFGENWAGALVALNLSAHVALGLMLVRLTARVTASGAAAWIALALFLGCHDIFKWVPFVISDTSFVLLAFAIFFLASKRILGEARGWLRIFALAGAAVFYRPTGAVLLPDLAWAAFLSRTRFSRVSPLALGAMLFGLAAASYLIFAWFIQDPARWPFASLSAAFDIVAHGYGLGEVVNARPETFHAPPAGYGDFVLLTADRFLHFFAPGAASFSPAHWAQALIFFVPTYALGGWLCIALCRGDTAFGSGERKVFAAAAGAVLAYALFHGLVQVDFDWRYRLPILPHLILLAGGGAADLLRRAGVR